LLTTSTSAFLSSRSYITLANIIEAEPVTLKHTAYRPLSKLWISTPNVPDLPAKLVYLCEHMKLVPISLSLAPQESYQLECQLQTALPAILAWAVQGCLQWQQQGLLEPESVKEASSVYQEEQDVLAPFLETCCVQDNSLSIRAHELHQGYLLWSRLQDAPCLSEQHFSQLIRAHSFYRSRQSSGYYYHGLALKTPLSQLSSEIKQISPLLIGEQPIYSASPSVKIE
jgi:putative DNA primase/helicase